MMHRQETELEFCKTVMASHFVYHRSALLNVLLFMGCPAYICGIWKMMLERCQRTCSENTKFTYLAFALESKHNPTDWKGQRFHVS
jgi:hypothetical protein